MRKAYNKFVRDHIPDIIRHNGDTCGTEAMTNIEFQQALRQKLVEEAQEVVQAATSQELITELADLYEVIDTLLHYSNMSLDTVKSVQERRRSERGGFSQRIKLLWTE
jgi:predicted house-cleaning noncanonical NTP pyrophosphatase (MazG superfamily)